MSGSYGKFMETLRGVLAGPKPTMIAPPSSKVERPVLAQPTAPDKQPPRWIHVMLNGKNGVSPTVAIRNDDAYIIGFTNSQGTWFQLSKTDSKAYLVVEKPPPVMTGFDGNYNTLIMPDDQGNSGGVDGLPRLNLNKFSTADAARTLWNHKRGLKDDEALKKAVATLCVVLCEAARFTPIYDVINKGWGKDQAVSITAKEVGYIKNWGDLSTQLLKWKSAGYKGDADLFKKFSSIRIRNGEQALAAVQLVKRVIRSNSLLAWLKYLWGLLVKNLQLQRQEDSAAEAYEKPTKGCSAAVNPL
ncbi:unnamed protein product [Urochloa decumbens]|uniref:rRNA N-glycosylase n=1 Tax=Urochloa decumbens TaxID=240449 RepID=A0ABC9AVS5_9POAL